MKKVSVVIPSYNRADAAIRCAKSALASDYPDVEVVIVDDCSPKCDVAALVKTELSEIANLHVIRNEKSLRTAATRNNGAKTSSGDYIFFVDDDNILEPSAIRLLVEAIESGKCAIAAPLAVNVSPEGVKTVWATSFAFNPWMSIPRKQNSDVPYDEEFDKSVEGKLFDTWYSPNAYMTSRETFDKLGGFDERYGISMEESDFCIRAKEQGMPTRIIGSARTWHHHYNDTGDMVMRKIANTTWKAYLLQRNRLIFAQRHYTGLQTLSICLVFAPLITLRYAFIAFRRGWPKIGWSFIAGHFAGLLAVLSGKHKQARNIQEKT